MTEFDNIAEMNDELFKNIEMVKKDKLLISTKVY